MSNINDNKKIHFLYKSTNQLNGNYYIGVHSTNKVEDSYIGSGKRFLKEVKKYGKTNFIREILCFFNTREDVLIAEYEMIKGVLSDSKCLNLCEGGRVGGLDQEARLKSKEKRDWLRQNDPEWNLKTSNLISEGLKDFYRNKPGTFYGKTHKPETIEKMKKSSVNRGIGNKNSQFGTCWITNGLTNSKIHKNEPIPEGWKLGRCT